MAEDSYATYKRNRFSGPIRMGKPISLREDFFAITWLHQFKIDHLCGHECENKTDQDFTNPEMAKWQKNIDDMRTQILDALQNIQLELAAK